MARRTVIVEIDRSKLRRLERNLRQLGNVVVPSAARETTQGAGLQAQRLLAVAFRRDIEGGPAPATRVRPGSPNSSVLVRELPGKGDGKIGAELYVNKRAARWLQFHLGDRKVRSPGEVGVARKANYVPQLGRLKRLGFKTPHGNIARGTLKRLVMMARAGSADEKGVFYGVPRGTKRPRGFYKRMGRGSAPRLLIAAAKRSRYGENTVLRKAWQTSVERAGGRMAPEAAQAVMRDVRKMRK